MYIRGLKSWKSPAKMCESAISPSARAAAAASEGLS